MAEPARKRATRADLETLPESVVGELIAGVLHTFPRPRPRHARAASGLGGDLVGPYDRGRSGPVGGWRRERLPALPEGSITLAPDWVCEVLSPTTRAHDLKRKRPLYAQAGVGWMWIVDTDARTLTASRLHDGRWLELGTWSDDDVVRIEPFDAVEIRLADLWG
jgi:hypothetical protein